MNNHREEIDTLRRRIQQNERHLGEMDWALLKDAGDVPSQYNGDPQDALLRAQNLMLKAQIEKLEALVQ